MCDNFPFYTFHDKIVEFMGISCNKEDLFINYKKSKEIHDVLQIIDKRFICSVVNNKLSYNFILFSFSVNFTSYSFENTICTFEPPNYYAEFIENIKDYFENFNIMMISVDIFSKKYNKYAIYLNQKLECYALYNNINCKIYNVSTHIHDEIEILMDFLTQNFVDSDKDFNNISFMYNNDMFIVGLDKFMVNHNLYDNIYEAIDYIKSIVPEKFKQKSINGHMFTQ